MADARTVALALAARRSSWRPRRPSPPPPPDDLSADPLDRGALLALPSVYRVDDDHARQGAAAPPTGARCPCRREGRELEERGTAFAVAPGGWLVTAAHVAAPDDDTVARLAYQAKLSRARAGATATPPRAEWVREAGARPVGAASPAWWSTQADAGAGAAVAARPRAQPVRSAQPARRPRR